MAHKFDKIAFVCFILPFLADRLSKYFIITGLVRSQAIFPFLNIYQTHNHGIAWGLGSQLNSPEFCWLNIIIAGVLIYFIWYIKSVAHHSNMIRACMLIISGGISNFCDRIWYGSVIDFIQLHYNDWYFAVFNVADISITIGATFLIYLVLFDEQS
jgi:signal peptidase II